MASDFMTQLQEIARRASQFDETPHKFANHNIVRATRDVTFEESFVTANPGEIKNAKKVSKRDFAIAKGEVLLVLNILENGDGVPYMVALQDGSVPPVFAPEDALELVSEVAGPTASTPEGFVIGATVVAQRDLTLQDIFGARGEIGAAVTLLRQMSGKSENLITKGEECVITEFNPFNASQFLVTSAEVPTGAPVAIADFALKA